MRRLYTGYGNYGQFDVMTLSGYAGYGQEEMAPGPTREEVLAATAAAEAAAQQAERQTALAAQQQAFNDQLISGFIASAAVAVVFWGLGQAILKGTK